MRRVLSIVLASAMTMSLAHAQADPDRDRRARQHYEDGVTQYNIASYPKAIEEFKRAYELTRAPGLLFNIAQAYRLAKDCANALTFYRNYVREAPGAPNRKDAEDFIKEVEVCEPSTPTTSPVPTPTPIPVAVEPTTGPEPTPDPIVETTPTGADTGGGNSGGTLRLAGWITGGVGVAVFGAGVLYGLKARGAQEDAEACTQADPCLNNDYQTIEDNGKKWEKLGIGGMAVGVAMVGAGVTMVLLGGRSSTPSDTTVSASPAPGGGSVFWQGRF